MFPELTTARLSLKQIKSEDQAFIFEGLSHPDVIRFYGVQYHSFEATAAQMHWYEMLTASDTGLAWKMVEAASGQAVGVVAVYFYKPEHNKAEIGFWLLPTFWDKGYASEALQIVIRYWKIEKDLHRLEAFVEEGNTGSGNVLERAGFVYEGTMRDCEIKGGRYISLLVYSLILSSK